MLKTIKSKISNILREMLIKISPNLYKKRYLGKYTNLSWHNYKKGKVEFEMLILPYFLNPDSIFFDIGANNGAYAIVAGDHIPQSQIYTFEPIPELGSRLQKLFPDAKVNLTALSNTKKETQFKIPKIKSDYFLSRGTLNTDYHEDHETSFRMIKVNTDTLDSYFEENNVQRVDVIKIDVEGHENSVIEGALKVLGKFKPTLIIEIEQRHHESDISNIINNVKEIGYSCFYFDNKSFIIKELLVDPKSLQNKEEGSKSINYIQNFIFVESSKVDTGYVKGINEKIMKDRSAV